MNSDKQNHRIWQYLLVVLFTIFLRILLIGGPPTTDEGIYAYNAFYIYLNPESNSLIPNKGILSLYAAATSWVFNLDLNHLIILRLIDALIASTVGVFLYITLKNECQNKKLGLLITLAFIFVMNDPAFIQYGYKNSIAIATIPLLCAIIVGQNNKAFSTKNSLLTGGLVACAVLLREPFVVFALLGCFASCARWGLRGSIYYILGGLFAGLFVVLLVCLLRQDNGLELIKAYSDTRFLYSDMSAGKDIRSMHSLVVYLKHSYGILLIISLFFLAFVWSKHRSSAKRYVFWISLSLVPLIEPALKNGFPYHFAVTLLGLSGLMGLLVRDTVHLFNQSRFKKIAIYTITIVFIISTLPLTFAYANNYHRYFPNKAAYQLLYDWPEKTKQESNVLIIADYLKKHANSKDSLSVNGNLLGLIPLTEIPPPNYELSNLNYVLLLNNQSKEFLYSKLLECPADWVVLTTLGGGKLNQIRATLQSIPQYKKIIYVPQKASNHYGYVDAEIYHWVAPKKTCKGAQ
ncbi:MAG TPA: hypothetical protein PLP44_07835 [Methylophilus sp.]|nr:hypothetical protein [Methylophilus sp.]